nr:hypothetical protein [Streptomyces umbrinus]
MVRGEAGIGKTALVDHLAAHVSDCRTIRAGGSEAEMELPFAGLHQLVALLLDDIDHLFTPQHEALDIRLRPGVRGVVAAGEPAR